MFIGLDKKRKKLLPLCSPTKDIVYETVKIHINLVIGALASIYLKLVLSEIVRNVTVITNWCSQRCFWDMVVP